MKYILALIGSFVTFHIPLIGSLTLSLGTLTTISTGSNNTQPQIALDPSGNALAVWNTNISNLVFAARFNATTQKWSNPVQISPSGAAPKVGVDKNGNGIAVWVNVSNTTQNNQIQASRFNATTLSWSTPISITTTGINTAPVLAVNSVGNAVTLWTTFPNIIQGATFNVSKLTWSGITILANNSNLPNVSVDQLGNAIAVWQSLNVSTISITAFRFTLP